MNFKFYPSPLAQNKKKKAQIVTQLLTNSVYMPDSKLYQSLEKRLNELSLNDLQNLKIIIDIKLTDTRAVTE